MFKLKLAAISLALIAFTACCTVKNEQKTNQESGSQNQNVENMQKPKPVGPAKYSPGTAGVYAELAQLKEDDTSFDGSLKVIRVLGYGASAPQIDKGLIIPFSVRKESLENPVIKAIQSKTVKAFNVELVHAPKFGNDSVEWDVNIIKLPN